MPTRVLVVEDNPADFRLLQEALLEVGAFDVKLTGVNMLGSAMTRLSGGRYDVALLDLSLPDTDGLEGLQELQRSKPELPVVVLTGRDDSELALRAVREGAQDYLVKGQVTGHLLVRAMRYAAERKRVMDEMRRNEERFRSLLENALDIITVLDEKGTILYASPSVERVLGYKPEELQGRSASDFADPVDAAEAIARFRSSMPGTASSAECRVRHKANRWIVLEAFGRGVIDDSWGSSVVVNARDVTERKRAEEQLSDANKRLNETNERLQAVIEASPLAIYVLGLDGRVLGWNSAAEQIFGWREDEVLSRQLPAVGEHARSQFTDQLEQARKGQASGPVESRYLRKDGANVEVTIWTSLLRDETGAVSGVVAVVADVTERKKLENQFRQAQKMEAIGRLAGGVAHDFNNLLTVITGYSQLAFNRIESGSPVSGDIKEVMQAADRAAALTKQLLMLSRRQVVEPGILDMNSVVVEMEKMLERIIGEDIQLTANLAASVSPVRADRGQMELVLLNLVVNARDAMPNGGQITIETGDVELTSGDLPSQASVGLSGPHVLLSVTDTGTGITKDVRDHIFEPFFTTKEAGKGTGLGLSSSYGIVRQYNGDILVESEVNLGTTFKVYLPVAAEKAPEETATAESVQPSRGSETILVVEDDPSVANVISATLKMNGYRILLAHEPSQAIDIVKTHLGRIHLLLSDMVLQTGHGVDLARQIRKLRKDLPVLFVSGYTGPSSTGQPFLDSGVAFLQKPFAPEVLVAKVREVLNQRQRSAGQ